MLKFKNIYSVIISILFILTVSCGDKDTISVNNEPEEIKKFEYLGYEFSDNKIVIHAKDYNPEFHKVMVNSSKYTEINQDKEQMNQQMQQQQHEMKLLEARLNKRTSTKERPFFLEILDIYFQQKQFVLKKAKLYLK